MRKLLIFLLGLPVLGTAFATGAQAPETGSCAAAAPLVRVAELSEASGVAASQREAGRLYAHNDSGEPTLTVLNRDGTPIGKLTIEGAEVDDWEALAVGPCPAGSCLYIGDIGDNNARRASVTIYRVPEPVDVNGSVTVSDVFHARYPDGPHDAEALLAPPSGDLLIVTKGETGPVAIYRLPREIQPGTTVTLQQLVKPRQAGKLPADERITDGAMSPSGQLVALRTPRAIAFYRSEDLFSGTWRELRRVPLDGLGEPQGEGIAFEDETTLYLVGEGGGSGQPGTFARLSCPR